MKRLQIPQKLVHEKFYVHEIAALNLSKIYFLKNAKKTCKPNNCDLHPNWITGAIKGISCEELYQELGLEYLQQRRWIRRLCLFYKVVSTKLPAYIYNFFPPVRQFQRYPNTFTSFSCRTEYFKNLFFLCVIREWNKLNPEIRSSSSCNIIWKSLLNFSRPSASKVYNISDTIDIKMITMLRLGFTRTQIQT